MCRVHVLFICLFIFFSSHSCFDKIVLFSGPSRQNKAPFKFCCEAVCCNFHWEPFSNCTVQLSLTETETFLLISEVENCC